MMKRLLPGLLPGLHPGLVSGAVLSVVLSVVLTVVLGGLLTGTAAAHLMDAQRGSLNVVDDGAYLVLSVPVSAFRGVDDDGDGRLSSAELQQHHARLTAAVLAGVQLRDAAGSRPLQGLLLMLSPDHTAPDGPAPQLLVLGRFALADATSAHTLRITLAGRREGEQHYRVQVTRRAQANARATAQAQAQPKARMLHFGPGHGTVARLAASASGADVQSASSKR